MSRQKTAYVTGGASGIGLALVKMLVSRDIKVAISDLNLPGAQAAAQSFKSGQVIAFEVNTASWNSQVSAFENALHALGDRIDYVYPIAGIGERVSIPNDTRAKGFVKPDLTVLDVDLSGTFYTFSLAVQQMRRQEKDESGFRGKIATVASVCGFYCVPTLPIYTAAKHGTIGFVRSFGTYLPEESITLNAVCPNVVRTNISTSAFYDQLEAKGLLTPMEPVIQTFAAFLDGSMSGECIEVGPDGKPQKKDGAPYLDPRSKEVCDLLYHRGRPLHQPR